jgi:uncharacterized protein YciI
MTERKTTEWIIQQGRERGFLAQPLFAIFTTPLDGYGPVAATSEAHLVYQLALEAQGTLFAAGPLCADDGVHFDGDGMIIVRASSMDEAREIADRDPMHKSGARTYRIRPWVVNEGTLSLTVHLSNQSVQIG